MHKEDREMKASELIKKLQELQLEFGDLEVKVDDTWCNEQQDIDYLYLAADNDEHWFNIVY